MSLSRANLIALTLVVVAAASERHAHSAGKSKELPVSPFALTKDPVVIDGVAKGKWTISASTSDKKCSADVAADGKLTVCQDLAAVFPLTLTSADGKSVWVTAVSASPETTVKVVWEENKLVKTAGDDATAAAAVAWKSDAGWRAAKLGDILGKDNISGISANQKLKLFLDHPGASPTLIEVDPPSETGNACPKPSYDAACSAFAGRHVGLPYVCFAYDGSWTLVASSQQSNVLRPNTSIAVLALVPADHSARLALEGEPTIYEPATSSNAGGTTTSTGCKTPVPVEAVFAPRGPGSHKLTITLRFNNADGDATSHEFIVDKTYSGAIRLGIGTVFGGARDRAYEARTLPGSGQAEIVTTQGGVLDAELVLGAAAFFDKGGRSYVASEPEHWAPYLGIGLLNQSATGLELLKSVHLGIEYEISAQYSIALTVVGRKVTRLADGLQVGEPITDMTVPTRTGYELGVGVVFNVSPDFFKFARKAGTSFFSGGS